MCPKSLALLSPKSAQHRVFRGNSKVSAASCCPSRQRRQKRSSGTTPALRTSVSSKAFLTWSIERGRVVVVKWGWVFGALNDLKESTEAKGLFGTC
ncbi:hypothetical protein CRENBAI_010577 [Crenichthys baileyi]|uniref:Uncharacterized protein n=1 Tax=Crenichthys baileyi TaxID=28760 RepID=A0AAV9SCJ3_9TELE